MRSLLPLPIALLACLIILSSVCADDLKTLDFSSKPQLFDSRFGRYGYLPKKAIIREGSVLHFHLPAAKDVTQTGLYSHFTLAGDFDIAATYEWVAVPAPQSGYGVSCGIAVDADDQSLSLARGRTKEQGEGYLVVHGKKVEGKMTYAAVAGPHPTRAKSGRLVLRREQATLICLTANKPTDEPTELCRVPFTANTIRKVRIFADAGGSPTSVFTRLSRLSIRGEEITHDIPERERAGWGRWLLSGLLLSGGLAGFLIVRRWRQGYWFWGE